jgi:hypothetical protein
MIIVFLLQLCMPIESKNTPYVEVSTNKRQPTLKHCTREQEKDSKQNAISPTWKKRTPKCKRHFKNLVLGLQAI